MTCIVSLVEDGKIYMGGDSAGIAGDSLSIRKDSKVFINRPMIFGFTSSFRMGQLIQYALKIPNHPKSKNDFAYLCTNFMDVIIDCFKNKGYAKINDSEISGGTFLVGYNQNLYKIYSDFQVQQLHTPYDSCGCGEDYALGALDILYQYTPQMSPKNKIRTALKTAETFSSGVAGPFNIISL